MIIIIILQVLLLLVTYLLVNSESTEIIKVYTKLGSKKGSKGNAITTDSKGSIYITGTTKNTSSNINDDDIFLLKCTSSGRKSFMKISGSSSPDVARGIASDNNDNIYIVGFTYGNLGIIIIIIFISIIIIIR